MLVVSDKLKEQLDAAGIDYAEYFSVQDLYLSYSLNIGLDQAMRFNDANPDSAEDVQHYINYVKDSKAIDKCVSKINKLDLDMLNIICDTIEGKHEEIMKYESKGEEDADSDK